MIMHSKYGNKTAEYPTKSKLAYWAHLTDINHHQQVRILIAKHFGETTRLDFFIRLRDKVKATQEITMMERRLECDVTTGMLVEIYRNYGKEVYTKVNNCL